MSTMLIVWNEARLQVDIQKPRPGGNHLAIRTGIQAQGPRHQPYGHGTGGGPPENI